MDNKCVFCNNGIISAYLHIENGKCFRCNGTGKSQGLQSKVDPAIVAKCYCGKVGYKSGESATTITEYDVTNEIETDFYFHDGNCMIKYFNKNNIDESVTNSTTFL